MLLASYDSNILWLQISFAWYAATFSCHLSCHSVAIEKSESSAIRIGSVIGNLSKCAVFDTESVYVFSWISRFLNWCQVLGQKTSRSDPISIFESVRSTYQTPIRETFQLLSCFKEYRDCWTVPGSKGTTKNYYKKGRLYYSKNRHLLSVFKSCLRSTSSRSNKSAQMTNRFLWPLCRAPCFSGTFPGDSSKSPLAAFRLCIVRRRSGTVDTQTRRRCISALKRWRIWLQSWWHRRHRGHPNDFEILDRNSQTLPTTPPPLFSIRACGISSFAAHTPTLCCTRMTSCSNPERSSR